MLFFRKAFLDEMFTLYRFKTLESTNLEARKYPINTIIIADKQTKGRGRFKRKWSSKSGGIYISFVIEPKSENLGIVTFLSALAVNRALKKLYNLKSEIKWPNDILFKGKKLAGILSESIIQGDKKKMIVGIGLNANNPLPSNLNGISLKEIFGKNIAEDTSIYPNCLCPPEYKWRKDCSIIYVRHYINKELIISNLIKEFEYLYKALYLQKRFNKIINLWKSECGTLGRVVKVKTIEGKFIGKAVDIDENCSLIIKLDNGSTKKIIEGDVGYVRKCQRANPHHPS